MSLKIRIKEKVLLRWQARATLSEIAANVANEVQAAVAGSTRDNERTRCMMPQVQTNNVAFKQLTGVGAKGKIRS